MYLLNIILIYIFAATALGNPISVSPEFQKYVEEIVSNLGASSVKLATTRETLDQLVCGNITEEQFKHFHKQNSTDDFYLVDKLLLEQPANSEGEKKAQYFFKLCENSKGLSEFMADVSTLKHMGEWPLKEKLQFTDNELAKLAGELASFAIQNLIHIGLNRQEGILEISSKPIHDQIDSIENTMNLLQINPSDNKQAIKDIETLISETNELVKFDENPIAPAYLKNLNEIKNLIPQFEWEVYFRTFTAQLNLNYDEFMKNEAKIRNPETLKKIVELMGKDENGSTLVNYFIWLYLSVGQMIDCKLLKIYSQPAIIHKFLKEYSNSDDRNNNIKMLNTFLKLTEKYVNDLNNQTIDSLTTQANFKIQFLQNGDTLFASKVIENFYETVQHDLNDTLSKISIAYFHSIIRDLIVNRGRTESDFAKVNNAMERYYETELDINAHNKPWVYYLISENLAYWKQIADESVDENKFSTGCDIYNDDEQKNRNYKKLVLALSYTGKNLQLSLEDNQKLKLEEEYLAKHELNHQTLTWLAIGQQECLKNGKKEFDEDLKNFMYQLKAFEFAASDKAPNGECKVLNDV